MLTYFVLDQLKSWICSPSLLHRVGLINNRDDVTSLLCAIFNLVLIVSACYVNTYLYDVTMAPLNLYRELGSCGYFKQDERISRQKSIANAQKSRKVGNTPPVFPNGWFRILDSKDLGIEKVKSVEIFGEQIAVFRNKRGSVRALGAYCPHLGANMGLGGRVRGDCLECPFHGWKFEGNTGKLAGVPYAKKVPTFASVDTWHCCEVCDVIYVWYHCDKSPPQYIVPRPDVIDELKYVGRTEHIVNVHIQDIPENIADLFHLQHLHKPVIGSDVGEDSAINDLANHGIEAEWRPCAAEEHVSRMSLSDDIRLKVLGRKIPLLFLEFEIMQIGPGVVHIHLRAPFFRGLMIQHVTPLRPLTQSMTHHFYISPRVPVCLGKLFYLLETTQIERDIAMWNNKTYLKKALLVKEESALLRHRRWYQQFYSENSPRIDESGKLVYPRKDDVIDW